MLLHAALGLVLSKYSNCYDVILGTAIANRNRAELEPIIGYFANTLVLRTNTDFDDFPDYLDHVKQVNLDAQNNQDIPFEQILEQCQVDRSNKHSPLFQISFHLDTVEVNELQIPEVNFALIDVHHRIPPSAATVNPSRLIWFFLYIGSFAIDVVVALWLTMLIVNEFKRFRNGEVTSN